MSIPLYAPIDLERLPKHVAIIMDGNGRWAKQHKLKVAIAPAPKPCAKSSAIPAISAFRRSRSMPSPPKTGPVRLPRWRP